MVWLEERRINHSRDVFDLEHQGMRTGLDSLGPRESWMVLEKRQHAIRALL
jgi:hypothetical protein